MKIIKTLGKIVLGLIFLLVVLFGLGYALTIGEYSVPETVAQNPSLPSITINGYTYHAETFGDTANPVVITLHGGPGGDYRSILSLQALSDEYFVVFFDQRGMGLSPRVALEEITIESAIADLDSVVDYFGQGQKVNIVGHSWGAMLASAYVGQFPEKVDHIVMAEPGFLNSEFAEEFTEMTQLKMSPGVLKYFLQVKFETLHIRSSDSHAADDYFTHELNLYQGEDHPQAGYYCPSVKPAKDGSWRYGSASSEALSKQAVDENGNFDINLAEGVERFEKKVLFMTGECQTYIGADFQTRQMELFPNAELAVISNAGHEMFFENPEESVSAVRAYLNAPAQSRNVPSAISIQQGVTDLAELESFLDEMLTDQIAEYHIAGAAVSVVKDGELIYAEGYGYADLENSIPVDPEKTNFRIGSVTKLFTWTAVMQLVEQGKLDLDADINTYLDFRIPDTYPQPITLKHLLTHTSGFEDRFFEFLVSDADDLVPSREWLVSHMAARVRPPDLAPAYSNYNADLAGYIVEQVSGQPYDQYVQENIFNPLGMLYTTARSPIPTDLRTHASVGYTYDDGIFQASPDYLAQLAKVPGAGIRASATDMARFMIAHLEGGRYSDVNISDARILQESTARQMHTTLYTPDARLLGVAYGFFEFSDNGQRTIGHGGEAPPMNSELLLLPDQNLGVFVVYNSEGGGELTTQHLGFQRAFFDHYYPAPAIDPIQPPADFSERSDRFVGSYRLTRGSSTTLEKVAELFISIEIGDPGDGTLLVTTPYGEWRFVEVEPLYFRQVDGPFGIAFREDERGRITHAYTAITPMFAFEKLNWYETPGFNMALALGCVLVFLSMIIVGSIRWIRRRRSNNDRETASRAARAANRIILGICTLNLLFLVGTALWGNPFPLYGVSMVYKIVLGLGVLSAAMTAAALIYTVLAWKNSYWGAVTRIYYTLVTVSAVAFVWFLNYWNLLGWRF